LNFFLISPFLATQKYGKIERPKKQIGTWSGVISSQPNETGKFLLKTNAIKFLGYSTYEIFSSAEHRRHKGQNTPFLVTAFTGSPARCMWSSFKNRNG